MSPTGVLALDQGIDLANRWLADLSADIGTADREEAYRALRAWMRTLRDRLPAPENARFAACLPEVLRGVYYAGWSPAGGPMHNSRDAYVELFAARAGVEPSLAESMIPAITRSIVRHVPPGTTERTLARLPVPIRELLLPTGAGVVDGSLASGGPGTGDFGVAKEARP